MPALPLLRAAQDAFSYARPRAGRFSRRLRHEDELFETLTLAQTRKIKPLPIILVGERYWRRVFDVDFLVSEGVIDPEDRELFWYAETAEEIWNDILRWRARSGDALL